MSQQRKINFLIIRTDRIGDTILTLPLAVELKKNYPDSRITFVCRNYTREIVELCKSIDEILSIDELTFFNFVRLIKQRNFEYGFLVYPRFKLALALFLANIKFRVGTKYRWYSFLFNIKIKHHRKESLKHELEYNLDLLEPLGIEHNINKSNVQFKIQTDELTEQLIYEKLKNKGFDFNKKTIIAHIGSGNSSIDLPKNKFRQLIETIARNLNVNIILTGNKDEREMLKNLFEDINLNFINLAGELTLKELFVLYEYADVFLSNSTGPIHIAATKKCKIIGFYPKVASCSAKRWGPYTNNAVIFEPKLDCSDCTIEKCKKLNCMETISIDEVYNLIKQEIN